MRMNSLIPLGVEYADPVNALARGAQARSIADEANALNALRGAYAQHGAGAMQGDTNALAAIAAYDPAAAQQLYTGVQNNRRADTELGLRKQDTRSAIAARSAGVANDARRTQILEDQAAHTMAQASREERAQAIATLGQYLPEFEAAPDAASWDRLAQATGQDDLVGQFGDRDTALAIGRGALRGAYQAQSPEGKVQADVNAGLLDPGTVRAEKPTSDMIEYEAAKAQGYTGTLQEWITAGKKAGATNITTNVGGDDKFADEFAKGDAAALSTISDAGVAAQRNIGRIDRLDALLAGSPSGAEAAFKAAAGEWGISTEGLDALQAAQALINTLVPEQRQPGSGPMSDADLALFKQSLPRLINQPGGNKAIIDAMRGIAEYDAEGAAIVQKLRRGEISRADAFDALQARVNPLANLNAPNGGAGAPAAAPSPPSTAGGVQWRLLD